MQWSVVTAMAMAVALASGQRDTRQVTTSINDLERRLAVLEANHATQDDLADARVGVSSAMSGAAMNALVEGTRQVNAARADLETLIRAQATQDRADVQSTINQMTTTQNTALDQMWSSINSLRDRTDTMEPQVSNAVADFTGLTGTGGLLHRLNQTHHSNPRIPVFRWAKWNTHPNANIGWFDENEPNGFGGVNPSRWTDGNAVASEMADSLETLTRLFIQKSTAPEYGATVCASVDVHYSSTDGTVCGAMFRIKNTGTGSITWAPAVTMSSWRGWSESASISVNGVNTWNADCPSECRFAPGLLIPGDASRERMSTVIFISTAGVNAGGGSNFHQRGTVLMFRDNALRLPPNLEFVDDFDVASGRWKL